MLWKKVTQGLSAGRVQSVATRMVVERERERMRFVRRRLLGPRRRRSRCASEPDALRRHARAARRHRVATGKDFDVDRPARARDDVVVLDEAGAHGAGRRARRTPTFAVRSVERKPYRRRPAAPFITSTFQQEAGRKLRLSSAQAMRLRAVAVRERLHHLHAYRQHHAVGHRAERGAHRDLASATATSTCPTRPRQYASKVKNAQEAHEAIRPAGDTFRSPEEVAREVNQGEARVYELIWKRTVASQMTDATGETVSVRLGATTRVGHATPSSPRSGTIITHPGFLLAYVEDADEGDAERDDRERRLPAMAEGRRARRASRSSRRATRPSRRRATPRRRW